MTNESIRPLTIVRSESAGSGQALQTADLNTAGALPTLEKAAVPMPPSGRETSGPPKFEPEVMKPGRPSRRPGRLVHLSLPAGNDIASALQHAVDIRHAPDNRKEHRSNQHSHQDRIAGQIGIGRGGLTVSVQHRETARVIEALMNRTDLTDTEFAALLVSTFADTTHLGVDLSSRVRATERSSPLSRIQYVISKKAEGRFDQVLRFLSSKTNLSSLRVAAIRMPEACVERLLAALEVIQENNGNLAEIHLDLSGNRLLPRHAVVIARLNKLASLTVARNNLSGR